MTNPIIKNLGYHRGLAVLIAEVFEDALERADITIPDDDREGSDREARLYGTMYYDLLDEIEALLKEYDENRKDGSK